MYGSPVSEIWTVKATQELAKLYSDYYVAEFRWCRMGVRHLETGQGFGATAKVLSSVAPRSADGNPGKFSCLEGPGHVEHPSDVLRTSPSLRGKAGERSNRWIFSRCFSAVTREVGPSYGLGTRSSGTLDSVEHFGEVEH